MREKYNKGTSELFLFSGLASPPSDHSLFLLQVFLAVIVVIVVVLPLVSATYCPLSPSPALRSSTATPLPPNTQFFQYSTTSTSNIDNLSPFLPAFDTKGKGGKGRKQLRPSSFVVLCVRPFRRALASPSSSNPRSFSWLSSSLPPIPPPLPSSISDTIDIARGG